MGSRIAKKRLSRTSYGQGRGETATPKQRAEYVRRMLNTTLYATDSENGVRDLLADLMHFVDEWPVPGEDFEGELEVARRNYDAEVNEANAEVAP